MKKYIGIVVTCLFAVILILQVGKVMAQSTNTPAVSPITSPLPPGIINYVAMGDSYSSGEGNAPWLADADSQACHRSIKAWPYVLTSEMNNILLTSSIHLKANIACSGAQASNSLEVGYKILIQPAEGRHPAEFRIEKPQIDAMTSFKPNLITITIGGNDIGFKDGLATCYMNSVVWHRPSVCTRWLTEEANIIDNFFETQAPGYYAAIRTAAQKAQKNARVIVVGYPRIFPMDSTTTYKCHWLNDTNHALMNALATELDTAASAAAKKAGVEYASTLDSLKGHELCTKDSWVNPLGNFNPLSDHESSEGHPTADGQKAMAQAVRDYLLSH